MSYLSLLYSKLRGRLYVVIYAIARPAFQLLRIDLILELILGWKRHIVGRLDGGIGSQVWQFAVGYSIAKDMNMPLYLDVDFFRTSCEDLHGKKNRHFMLFKIFPKIKKEYASKVLASYTRFYTRLFYHKTTKSIYEIEPLLYKNKSNTLWSFYMNYRYFHKYHKELKELFNFAEPQLSKYEQIFKDKISKSSACCLHIRRGDFVGSVHEVCTKSYYFNAIRLLEEKISNVYFFVFSNDEEYAYDICKEAGIIEKAEIFKNRNESDPSVDLYLMSQFSHFIISNSGFSWFPAWLNSDTPNQIVVLPKYWTRDEKFKELSASAMSLPNWIQLDC